MITKEWMRIDFKVETPMFTGRGAVETDNDGPKGPAPQADGFRIPELRGSLRFWFRAMVGAGQSTDQVRELEATIFGRAANDGKPPQGPAIRLRQAPQIVEDIQPEWLVRCTGLSYLLGLGLVERLQGQPWLIRTPLSHTAPANAGAIEVASGPYNEIIGACLWCVGALGGLGARPRKGFGSVQFLPEGLTALGPGLSKALLKDQRTEPSHFFDPAKAFDVVNYVRCLLKLGPAPFLDSPQDFPVLAPGVWRLERSRDRVGSDALEALDYMGVWYRRHRATVRRENKPPYHRWATPEYQHGLVPLIRAGTGPRLNVPLGGLGLPIQITQSSNPNNPWHLEPVGSERVPSPLWLKVAGIDSEWRGVAHGFRVKMLDHPDRVQIRQDHGRTFPAHLTDDMAWARVNQALDSFKGNWAEQTRG